MVQADRPRSVQGSALELLSPGVTHLDPREAVWRAMLRGWELQQSARLLNPRTINTRLRVIARFAEFNGEYPWNWQPCDVEEWTVALKAGGAKTHATLRGYQNALALFCGYLTDPRYHWGEECIARFGTHPVQICHEWNTARHVTEFEARPSVRPFTREELQRFFDYCDDKVETIRSSGRKGWVSAFRDAALFKTIYAFGLRRREAVMLDVSDFHRNAVAPEFGRFGSCTVRWGKATKGSPPRRRNVVAVFPWSAAVLAEYVDQIRPLYDPGQKPALWPTERGSRITTAYAGLRFREYADHLGLDSDLHLHCLRHAYVTHLIEEGWDGLFVQQQVGHAWGSTTALYSGVSSDYKNTQLRAALAQGLNRGNLHHDQ